VDGEEELDPAAAVTLLRGTKKPKAEELSPDEAVSFLRGVAPPEPPSKLQAFGGSLLESLGAVPQALAAVTDYMGGAAPEHGYGARGPLPSWGPSGQPPTTYAQGPQIGQGVFGPAGQALQQAGQAVYPEEQRGRGGLGEQLASGAGSIAGSLPALMGGPVAAGVQFGAAQGIPLYHEIKKSTGDEEAAMWGLLFGGAVGQLDQFPGAKRALGGIVKKLASSELKDVVVHSVLGSALKHAATQAGVGAMQRTLSMALQEKLTGKDIDILKRVAQGLPADLILGGGMGALLGAVSRLEATPAEGKAARPEGATPKVEPQGYAPEEATLPHPQEPTETTSAVELPETATAEPQAGPVEAPEAQPTSSAIGTSYPETATRPGSVSASEPSVPEAPPEKTVELLAGLPPIKEGTPQEHAAETTSRVKEALYEGLIKTHGGKPELAARLEERSKGEVNAAALEARGNVRAVKRAIRQHEKTAGETLAPERIQEAMQSPKALAALPDAVRPHVAKMRDQADRLSRVLVSEGMTDKTMAQAIQGRMGEYLRTSYQAHSDPAWAKKVPQDVRNRLKSLLVSWSEPLRPEKLTELEQRQANEKLPSMERRKAEFELGSRHVLQGKAVGEIEAEMQALLDDAKATAENPWAALVNSNLKRKDLSIFKARKGLPDELKAFLGEEKDPYANYTNTILKQASFVANHRKLKAIRDVGIGKWLFEKPTIQEGNNYTVRVSAADNPRLAPLVGDSELYTTEKIKKALFDSQPSYSKGWKWAMAANAAIKGTKTIYQLHAVPKQAVSQITALLKNGHIGYALANAKRIVRAMSGADKEAQLELTRLGILGESVAAAEFRDVKEQFTGKKIAPAYQGLARANDLIGAAFGKPDDFSKVAGFYAETAALKKAGFSEAQAKEHAANIVRNLYPTYSRITKWVDKFRRQPLVGTFMAFKAEQARTNFERLKLIGEELKSGNDVLAARAKKRIGYLLAGQAAAPAAAVAWNMLNGVDSDEDDDRRLFVPEWDQQRNLVWEGGDKKGTYTDLSDIDEGSWLTDPLLRIADGEDASKVLGEMYREDVEPFASFSLLSKMAIEYVRGEKMDGTPIDDRAAYLREQLTPSSIRNFDPRGLSGLRPVEFDVEKSLGISTSRFAREIADLTGKRHRMERKSPGEKASIVGEQEQSRKELFQTLSDQARAAVRLGMPYSKVKGILDASLSSEMTDAVLSGRYIKYTEKKKR